MPVTVFGAPQQRQPAQSASPMEHFAEMALQIKHAKTVEAQSKVTGLLQNFVQLGIVPKESDLKSSMKEGYGFDLTPETMNQISAFAEQRKAQRESEAKSAAAAATTATNQATVTGLQAESAQRLADFQQKVVSGELTGDALHKEAGILQTAGLLQLSSEDQFQANLANIPADQESPIKGKTMREYAQESWTRHNLNLKSFDELAQDAAVMAQRQSEQADQVKYQNASLDIQKQGLTDQQARTAIAGQQLSLERQRLRIEDERVKFDGRAKTFSAISDFLKTRSSTALEAAKNLTILKKEGYPVTPEIEEKVAKGLAESMVKTGIQYNADGEPIGMKELETLIEGKTVPGWTHPIDKLLGKTGTTYLFSALKDEDVLKREMGSTATTAAPTAPPPKKDATPFGVMMGIEPDAAINMFKALMEQLKKAKPLNLTLQ